jgi:hypothetical protein
MLATTSNRMDGFNSSGGLSFSQEKYFNIFYQKLPKLFLNDFLVFGRIAAEKASQI